MASAPVTETFNALRRCHPSAQRLCVVLDFGALQQRIESFKRMVCSQRLQQTSLSQVEFIRVGKALAETAIFP